MLVLCRTITNTIMTQDNHWYHYDAGRSRDWWLLAQVLMKNYREVWIRSNFLMGCKASYQILMVRGLQVLVGKFGAMPCSCAKRWWDATDDCLFFIIQKVTCNLRETREYRADDLRIFYLCTLWCLCRDLVRSAGVALGEWSLVPRPSCIN